MIQRRVANIVGAWFLIAALAVVTGVLRTIPVPPPVIVAVLALASIAGAFGGREMRAWTYGVDMRVLLLPHLIRFVGISFLLLVQRGILATAFVPIGWGDAIAATGALLLLAFGVDPTHRGGRAAWLAWNLFGLADMALLIVTGVRLVTDDPSQFAMFRKLPFGLLPTFFVPLIIATHVVMLVRLLRRR